MRTFLNSKRLQIGQWLLACIFMLNICKCDDLYDQKVFSTPLDVGHLNVTLNLEVEIVTPMPIGAAVELILPVQDGLSFDEYVYNESPECFFQGAEALPDNINCTFEKQPNGREAITWISSHDPVGAYERFSVWAENCFNNPITTEVSEDFELRIYSEANKTTRVLLDQQLIGLNFQPTFEPLEADNNFFTQADGASKVVGEATTAIFTIKSNIPLPSSAFFKVDMPKVNPGAPRSLRKAYVDKDALKCTAVEKVDAGLYCEFFSLNNTHDRIKIKNIFPSGQPLRDVVNVIKIEGFTNPFSTGTRYLQSSIAIISQKDGEIYYLQIGDASFRAPEPTGFSFVEILSDDHTVQEYTAFTVAFQPSIDIEAGAFVMVQFPTSDDPLAELSFGSDDDAFFQFDPQLQLMSTIGGIFGSRSDGVNFTTDSTSMKVVTLVPTERYSVISIAKIMIEKIKNPAHIGEFGSFRITVFDNDMAPICDQYTDMFYTVTTGNILDVSLSLGNYAVQKETNLRVQFAPLHMLEPAAIIYIELPIELTIPCPTVFELNSDQLVQPLDITCEPGNKFLINAPFYEEYKYVAGEHGLLVVTFQGINNALSARNLTTLIIETRMGDGEAVDRYVSDQTQLTIVPSPFFGQSILTDTDETFTDTIFTFTFVLADKHIAKSYLEIFLPPEVALSDRGSVVGTTYSIDLLGGSDPSGTDPYCLKVNTIVSLTEREKYSGDTITIEVRTLKTPLTTFSTQTFKVYSRDSEGYIINQITSDFYITMMKGKSIEGIKVTPDSFVVGQPNMLTFDLTTPVPMLPTDQIRVMFPDQVAPPRDISGKCKGGNALADVQSDCQSIAEVVTAKSLVFRDDSQIQRRRLAIPTSLEPGTNLQFKIEDSRNPQTGAPSGPFKFYIQNSEGYVKAEMSEDDNNDMVLTMDQAAPVKNFEFKLTDDRQQAPTAVKITWYNEMPYPKDSYLFIKYREDQIGPVGDRGKGAIKCSSNLQLTVECILDIQDRITVKGMFAEDLVENQFMYLVISGLFNDVFEPTLTESWELTVYTTIDGTSYHIDTIASGLDYEWFCSIPCETCSANNPLECYSCNYMSNKTIFYENYCYEECPGTTYYDPVENTCKFCDENCQDCADYNPKICLSCNPTSAFPFLDGTTCKSECPFGRFANYSASQCQDCEFPCQSCTEHALDCNTCDIRTPNNAYFMNGVCQDKCDDGYTVPIGNTDFVCQQCDENCKTCAGDLSFCMSCKDQGQTLLSMHDHRCYTECPPQITVRVQGQPVCQVCDDNCKTCEGSTDTCTSCKDGTYLYQSRCVQDCTTIFRNYFVNNEEALTCDACQYPCDTCQTFTDRCLTCQRGWVMHEYSCVRACPDKYTDQDGQCVLTGFFCPFGYIMSNGNSCILQVQICLGNDILNYDKTKCVPQPDRFFPFPMLILLIISTVAITYAKFKLFPFQMRWIACMISMLSVFEMIGLACLVILSGKYGIAPAFTLSFMALLFLIGLNLFCFLIYKFQLKQDSAFKYWEQEFNRSTLAITILGFVINFKIHRMFYSRFWGRRDFEAVFSDEIVFYRSVMFSSSVYIITCILPIIIATIFVLIYVPFGYQLQMFGLEMFIIEVFILILLVIELYKIRKHFFIKAYYKVKQEEMGEGNQFLVMAGVPSKGKETFEHRYSSYTVSIMERIIHKIDDYNSLNRLGTENRVQTIKEIQDLRELEYDRNKLRRCTSFADLREERLEIDPIQEMLDKDSDQEKNVWENFVSEPSSPTAQWFPKEGNTKETLRNPYFHGRIQQLSKVQGGRGQFDNCYHQGLPAHMFHDKEVEQVSRAVQANVLELLGVDDLLPQYSTNIKRANKESSRQVNEDEDIDSVDANMFSKGLVSKVLENFEGFQEKRKRKTLPPNRARMLPEFMIQDIQGNLDIDEDGNFIIISDGLDKNGQPILEDIDGHRVNKRGYLINNKGNIVLRDGTLVFRPDEIEDDGEIPAPYCYMKKDNLGMSTDMFGDNGLPNIDPNANIPEQDLEEQAIDQEYRMMKNQGIANQRYDVKNNELDAERSMRSDEMDNSEAALAPSKQIKRLVNNQPLLYNPNDEDFITQISRPVRPKPKNQLMPQKQQSQKPQKSPKRSSVSLVSQQKSVGIYQKTENDGHTSIDADFLMGGNIGEVESFKKINDKFDKQSQEMIGLANEINVPMAIRPSSGVTHKQMRRRGKSGKTRTQVLRADQQQLLLENTDENYKRDREQEILEGLDRFQAMLARYPLKVRQSKSTNTLANKQLSKVYGKIKMQYTKQIQIPDNQYAQRLERVQTPNHIINMRNSDYYGKSSFTGGSVSKIHPTGLSGANKMKKISSIYQQDLRNKAISGHQAGLSTFSLKSNKKIGKTSGTISGQVVTNQSMLVGGQMSRIIAINQDPSNYGQMDGGSGYNQVESEHELDEMRVNQELRDLKIQNQISGIDDDRGSMAYYGSQSSGNQADINVLLQNQNSGSSMQMRGSVGKNNQNLMDGSHL